MGVVKKGLQFSYGLFAMGKDSISHLAKDLKKKYDLDEEKSKKIARDIIADSVKAQKRIAKVVKAEVEKALKNHKAKNKKTSKKTTKKKSAKKPVKKKPAKRKAKK